MLLCLWELYLIFFCMVYRVTLIEYKIILYFWSNILYGKKLLTFVMGNQKQGKLYKVDSP